ncbi:MAG: flagellar basal body rod protein FlgC [Firmicutes bacterium]|nr:flagellar basal body rod protein FlgC [Bacillota bacterium]
MGFLNSMNISGSALTAQRLRMDVIAENIANANTTRTATGQPYRRRLVLFGERNAKLPFSDYLSTAQSAVGKGVRVTQIIEDESPMKIMYDPSHPDCDENGYVRMPNVDTVKEMIDMMSATRSYEANVTAINAFKNMAMKSFDIGK